MSQEQIRIRELETALEANRTLLALESEKVLRVQHQLVCIGQELGGEQFDVWQKGNLETGSSPEELASEIVRIVKTSLGVFRGSPDVQAIMQTNRELEEVGTKLDVQTKRAKEAESQAAELRNQVTSFEKNMAEAREKIKEFESIIRASKAPSVPKECFLMVSGVGGTKGFRKLQESSEVYRPDRTGARKADRGCLTGTGWDESKDGLARGVSLLQ